jgi:Xaa-Pro dipeptidase
MTEASIPSAEFAGRVDRLRAWLADEGLDVAYVSAPPNIAYLSGLSITPMERLAALIVPHEAEPILVVPELEGEAARANPAGFGSVTWTDAEGPSPRLRETFERVAGRRGVALAVEKDALTVRALEHIRDVVDIARVADLSPVLTELRMRKSEAELALLRAAAEVVDACLAELPARLRLGRTEAELAFELDGLVRRHGGEGTPFATTVLAGPNAALPHGHPGRRPLQDGDLVIADFGAVVGGYCADVTRTFVVGEPSEQAVEVFEIVRRAQERGVAAVRPGASCSAVDAAARSVIADAGYADHFVHRTGHGLGLEVHEPPSLVAGVDRLLEPGMVVTVEPGVYLPGFAGVRIEDDVVVTADGGISLTRAPRDLIACPV